VAVNAAFSAQLNVLHTLDLRLKYQPRVTNGVALLRSDHQQIQPTTSRHPPIIPRGSGHEKWQK
jgi:hypothetical protein